MNEWTKAQKIYECWSDAAQIDCIKYVCRAVYETFLFLSLSCTEVLKRKLPGAKKPIMFRNMDRPDASCRRQSNTVDTSGLVMVCTVVSLRITVVCLVVTTYVQHMGIALTWRWSEAFNGFLAVSRCTAESKQHLSGSAAAVAHVPWARTRLCQSTSATAQALDVRTTHMHRRWHTSPALWVVAAGVDWCICAMRRNAHQRSHLGRRSTHGAASFTPSPTVITAPLSNTETIGDQNSGERSRRIEKRPVSLKIVGQRYEERETAWPSQCDLS